MKGNRVERDQSSEADLHRILNSALDEEVRADQETVSPSVIAKELAVIAERPTKPQIRTLIAAGDRRLRGQLVAALTQHTDIEVIAQLQNVELAIPVAETLRPDVALIASDLSDPDAFTVVRHLSDQLPTCRSVIVASAPRAGDLRHMVAAGAYGLILSETPPAHIANAIRQVANGRRIIDPDLAFAAADSPSTSYKSLTPREREVLRMVEQGASMTQIAEDLCLSVGRVRRHLSRIITKTGARDQIDGRPDRR